MRIVETSEIGGIASARDLAALVEARLPAGQRELASAMRALIASVEPHIAQALSDVSEEAFLEPLLFSYFASEPGDIGLGQLLFGHVDPAERPHAVEIVADGSGRFYVPAIGYFATASPHAHALLIAEGGGLRVEAGSAQLPLQWEPIACVPGTRIELLTHIGPLLEPRFVTTGGHRTQAQPDPDLDRRAREVARALDWLAQCAPEYSGLLHRVTRQACVFRARDVNSFASINAHGVAFFNTAHLPDSPDDAVFFYDELVHQCGHIIFNAVTTKRADFLAVDPETPLSTIAPDESDARTVYDALHGLYTEHVMSRCMLALEQRRIVSDPQQAHELRGRLAFIAHKYCVDLANLAHARLFTPLGRSLYDYFRISCLELLRARPDLMALDMQGQPYNFDYLEFAARNPMNVSGATRAS